MIFKMLPKALYPEYQNVYSLMRQDTSHPCYTPLSEHVLVEILPSVKAAVFEDRRTGSRVCFKLSLLVVLIGSSPDLDFMEPELRRKLAVVKDDYVPIGRNNPVDIDLFTNEVVDAPGVYAMGPLVGDNFVRFLLGGALAITRDVIRKEKKDQGGTLS